MKLFNKGINPLRRFVWDVVHVSILGLAMIKALEFAQLALN